MLGVVDSIFSGDDVILDLRYDSDPSVRDYSPLMNATHGHRVISSAMSPSTYPHLYQQRTNPSSRTAILVRLECSEPSLSHDHTMRERIVIRLSRSKKIPIRRTYESISRPRTALTCIYFTPSGVSFVGFWLSGNASAIARHTSPSNMSSDLSPVGIGFPIFISALGRDHLDDFAGNA
jgi:hypothetical protein